MNELQDRRLFYALSRRVWEIREELDLLIGYIGFKFERREAKTPFKSDSHLPGTYRGGMVARLQRLLVQQPDGTFTPERGNSAPSAGNNGPRGLTPNWLALGISW